MHDDGAVGGSAARARVRQATVVLTALGGMLAGTLTGCTGDAEPPPHPSPGTSAPLDLDASVAQFRFDEGTRSLRAGFTNRGDSTVRVSQATIAWDGFAFPTVPIPDGTLGPGESAAFTIEYGAPQCLSEPAGRPRMGLVVDGRSTSVPLRVEDPQLLDRLRGRACAEQRLDSQATVGLSLKRRSVMVGGEEYLPGRVLVTHRTGATDPVRLIDLGGSVLLNLVPRDGPGALPTRLRPRQHRLAFPVLAGSAHRCDAHARSQSSQTFLISAYLRVGRDPIQRHILTTSPGDQERLLAIVDRDCR